MPSMVPFNRETPLTYKEYLRGTAFHVAGNYLIAQAAVGEIKHSLDDVRNGIEGLESSFTYGLGLITSELQAQSRIQQEIVEKLDDIYKTLESPLATQARELYKKGISLLSNKILNKALESFHEAEKKNDTDFMTQFQIGKLYLYGIDEDDDVLDIPKAEKHLKLAIRYGEPNAKPGSGIDKLCAESCLHASIACYIQGNEAHLSGDGERSAGFYNDAVRLCNKAIQINPELTDAYYHLAKYYSILGDSSASENYSSQCIKSDIRYVDKFKSDRDFEQSRAGIERISNDEVTHYKNKIKELIEEFESFTGDYVYETEGQQQFEKIINESISWCKTSLHDNTVQKLLAANRQLKTIIASLKSGRILIQEFTQSDISMPSHLNNISLMTRTEHMKIIKKQQDLIREQKLKQDDMKTQRILFHFYMLFCILVFVSFLVGIFVPVSKIERFTLFKVFAGWIRNYF